MSIQVASVPTITIHNNYLRAKRIVDIMFTLLILIPLCIIVAIVAVLIRLDSKGPIFFRQKRVGANGKEFEMLKFRSMYHNSDDTLHREATRRFMNGSALSGDTTKGDKVYKLTNDSRITKVGNILRKTSIDEIPQFFNILRGDMTLVGPRPALSYEVEHYSAKACQRLAGKPGLTGPWQVYGRSRVSFEKMVEMDIEYLHQQSLSQDLKLIALTLPAMLLAHGAA